jgi:nucleotide-binding universal stress UspA family protein
VADRGAGMVVIGSRGESALKGLVLGSVAHKLLHLSPAPVLVVPV